MFKKTMLLFSALVAVFLGTACSEPFITNTSRSAVEQLLLCATIERGISKAEFARYKGKTVQLDYSNLAPQVDKNLIMAYTEMHLACEGVIVSKSAAQKPDYIVQVACGVLATDIDKMLLGTPALPIPVPDTDISIVIPEIPLYRRICRSAYGRFYFNIIDAKSMKPVECFAGLNAQAQFINWTILLVPFKSHNVPLHDDARVSHEIMFPDYTE